MNIDAFEINLWRKWKRDDNGDTYSFIPGQYNSEGFEDFQMGLLTTSENRAFQIGFKVFEDGGKAMLQIVDVVYQIKRIDGGRRPATMQLIDKLNNEISFTEVK